MRRVCLLLVLMTVLVSLAACTLGDISDIFGYRFNDFTEEEKELFYTFLSRAITNMGGDPCHRKSKEEPKQ